MANSGSRSHFVPSKQSLEWQDPMWSQGCWSYGEGGKWGSSPVSCQGTRLSEVLQGRVKQVVGVRNLGVDLEMVE